MISDRLQSVRDRMAEACRRAGRAPSAVRLVAATKGVPVEVIREAIALGMTDLGENRVQEASAKQAVLGPEPRTPNPEPIRWHMIGHLQSNKAGLAVKLFDAIHSLDSFSLIQELERQALKERGASSEEPGEQPVEVFVQVNVSGEGTTFGCRAEDTVSLARAIVASPHLRLAGLMTMAPFSADPESARPHFRRLRELRDETARALNLPRPGHREEWAGQPSALSLSMGMSHDFEVAIEEGADLVRIGTAIFGDRRPET